ncbi:MAG: cytidylate kinase-like family protein [Acidobacteria bacterium]|nr:cytidylate kinase-like family protein [Acidobacteriota bacterium]
MTPDQRAIDFQTMAAAYAKQYAPANWKIQTLGFNLFDLGPWLNRVRAAKDDLEFYEISAEYVARLEDTHSSFITPSHFTAWLGFSVDLYDNRVLIEQVNRSRLPMERYPFEIGDELVSVDGHTAEQWIAEFSRFLRMGNPRATRRYAADSITYRVQSEIPRAAELPESAAVIIRGRGGETALYTIPWLKSGAALKNVGPVPSPRAIMGLPEGLDFDMLRRLFRKGAWTVSPRNKLFRGETEDEDGSVAARRYLLGWGATAPRFRLPDFTQRLGRNPFDFFYSGVYSSHISVLSRACESPGCSSASISIGV